mgnify:CR=1 FL=1
MAAGTEDWESQSEEGEAQGEGEAWEAQGDGEDCQAEGEAEDWEAQGEGEDRFEGDDEAGIEAHDNDDQTITAAIAASGP